ncbi:SRPBCC family protein [Pedobacter boryungensis]|uniref:DUF2892 domain-containing protein n=1 Tax=Pedobacter boryungensis TaxID=869962 RepID=A0ABX2DAI8_9SPHI|nr:SRPBCC family protein [Pedobacter boryungensis]NQX31083.1 DUF2892 domain-containing protein [Pedobacter boryungensis]
MENTLSNNIINKLKDINIKPTGTANIDTGERALSFLGGTYLLYKSFKLITTHPVLALEGVAASGLLIYRGATGVCPVYRALDIDTTDPEALQITETLTVNAPREKVYAFWRELANLPKFMSHLKQVIENSATHSHWAAQIPGNPIPLTWNAEITHEEQGSYIGWQSTQGSMIEHAGKITFTDTLNAIGTELHVELNYFAPAGSVGRTITSLFNGLFEKMIRKDIQSFKDYVEQADFLNYAGLTAPETAS